MAELEPPLGIKILSALLMIGGGFAFLFSLLLGARYIQVGLKGIAVTTAMILYSIGGMVAGYWLSDLDSRGYHTTIWLLTAGAALQAGLVIISNEISNFSPILVNVIVAGYVWGKRDLFQN